VPFLRDVLEMPDHELDRELDALLCPLVASDRAWDLLRVAGREDRPDPLADALSDETTRFPRFAAAVHAAIEARARQLADADRIDAEVERRAAEIAEVRAREIAAARLRELGPHQSATVATEALSVGDGTPGIPAATERRALPPGIDPRCGLGATANRSAQPPRPLLET
jgi:hypothetical protein